MENVAQLLGFERTSHFFLFKQIIRQNPSLILPQGKFPQLKQTNHITHFVFNLKFTEI